MKKIIIILLAVFAISCSSNKFSKQTSIHFDCILQKQIYLMQVPNLLMDNKFELTVNDFEKGIISGVRKDTINKRIVEITLDVNYDEKSNSVTIKPVAFIQDRDGDYNEYYDLEHYNEDYKHLFYDLVSLLKSNCNKNYFPNKP